MGAILGIGLQMSLIACFEIVGGGLKDSEIASFVTKHQISLPSDLKEFYRTINGGYPISDHFEMPSGRKVQVSLMPLIKNDEEFNSVDEALVLLGDHEFMDGEALPIGDEIYGGDIVYYSLKKETFGQIYLHTHEAEDDSISLLAPSFKDLLEKICGIS